MAIKRDRSGIDVRYLAGRNRRAMDALNARYERRTVRWWLRRLARRWQTATIENWGGWSWK